jgi:hypothetical protein
MPISKAVKNNRVFFSAKIMTNSSATEYNEGIWSFGRKNVNYPFSLTLDVIDENVNTSGIQAFGTAGNYFFVAHSNDGSIDKTNDSAVYDFDSVYETQILNFGDSEVDKTLVKARVSFRKLTTGESVTLKYRVDGATAWTTIGSFSTVGGLSKTFTLIESSAVAFASGKEYEFRVESTGGAEITGLELQARVNSKV